MNDDGSDPASLINGPGGEYSLDWSPDGNYLAFCYSSSKDTANIYVMDVNTLESTRVTNHNWDVEPRWSPDSKLIAFSSGPRTYTMYMVYPDGSGETPLKSGNWIFADWQP
jgi:Tol biopolymer transport system component